MRTEAHKKEIVLPEMIDISSPQGDYRLGSTLVRYKDGDYVRSYTPLQARKYLQDHDYRLPIIFKIFHAMNTNSNIDNSTFNIDEHVDDILIPIEKKRRTNLYKVRRITESEVIEKDGDLIRVGGKEKIILVPGSGNIAGIDRETMFPTDVSDKSQEEYHNAYWHFDPELPEIYVVRGGWRWSPRGCWRFDVLASWGPLDSYRGVGFRPASRD